MKSCIFYFSLCLIPFFAHAQQGKTALENAKPAADSIQVLELVKRSNKSRIEKVDYVNAKKFAEDANSLAKKANFSKGIFISYIALGYVLRDMGEKTESISYLKKALEIIESNKLMLKDPTFWPSHINTYTAISEVYSYIPDYANAQNSAFKALELSTKYNIQSGQCWITLSILCSRQNNFQEAKSYALKALDYFEKANNKDDMARVYSFLGKYAVNDRDAKKAIEYYTLSYQNYKAVNSLYGMRISLYNLASIYLKIRDYINAEHYISETIKITNQNDVISQFHVNQLFFDIKYDRKDYRGAIKIGNTILNYANQDKGLQNISTAYQNLYRANMALKDTANAFLALGKISSLKDSLFNTELAKNTAALSKKYESEKQQQQIAFLDKESKLNFEKLADQLLLSNSLKAENNLKQEKINQEVLLKNLVEKESNLRQKNLKKEAEHNKVLLLQNSLMKQNSKSEFWVRILLIILLVGLIVFGLTLLRGYRQQKTSNKKILLQREKLKFLMKELHHRVKNNLQVIVAMLRMQARTINDKKAINALENAEIRLQAIALIHKKLYKSEHYGDIALGEYLRELLESLSVQHQNFVKEFSFQVKDPANLHSDFDTAISIGLIVNELVANAFKYAFTGLQTGKISITINRFENQYKFEIQDNGSGIEDWEAIKNQKSFGFRMINLFVEQLQGSLDYQYSNGSKFTICFPETQS